MRAAHSPSPTCPSGAASSGASTSFVVALRDDLLTVQQRESKKASHCQFSQCSDQPSLPSFVDAIGAPYDLLVMWKDTSKLYAPVPIRVRAWNAGGVSGSSQDVLPRTPTRRRVTK